jgi:2-polyprenyl-6-methoxyphenol hydroxylase-like FAD-dependent oxidoreductase
MSKDVLVVGAGPTGMSAAITLRRFGVAVRIIDRQSEPALVSKALVLWSATLETLQGMGVIGDFQAAGRRLHTVRIGDGARQVAELAVGDGIDSAFPFPVLLSQARTENILRQRLAALGVEVERGLELVDLEQDAEGVTVSLRRADGSTEACRVRFLVGSDGADSAVRQVLGVAFEGLTGPQTILQGDVHIDGGDLDGRSLYIWRRNGGTVALVPFEENVWRVVATRDGGPADQPTTLEQLQQTVDRHCLPGLHLSHPTGLSVFHTNERLAAHYRRARCFLAGDAAHCHSPAGGQGMNIGIQDGVNLGWKLAYVLQGHGDAELLLGSYEAERRTAAPVAAGDSALRLPLAFSISGVDVDAALAIVGRLPALQKMLQVQLSETATVGARAPDAEWRDLATGEKRSLQPLLAEPRHSLLIFEDKPGSIDVAKAVAGAMDRIQILRFDAASDPDGQLRQRYHVRGPSWVLIRPDQMVAARGTASDLAVLDLYLDRVVRLRPRR